MSSQRRASTIKPAGSWRAADAVDRVVLDADDRQRRRIVLTAEMGTRVLLDFAQPVTLHDGDGLVLEDGSIVLVAGQVELLLELATRTPLDFLRLAWHLGNRHTDVQFTGDRLRIRRDHVLEGMVKGLGASVAPIAAPFDPEAPAPGDGHSHHAHDHDDHDA